MELKKSSSYLQASHKILGVDDGTVLPSIENRLKILHEIRSFKSDLVFTHRPNDYHPDHRYTSKLVEDSAYMVMVPLVLPETPPLKKNPIFLYFNDPFKKPLKFSHDIVVDISSVLWDKAYALDCHQSQMWEWMPWIDGKLEEIKKLENQDQKQKYLLNLYCEKTCSDNQKVEKIQHFYGQNHNIPEYCESFEFCEYGVQLDSKDITFFFPMISKISE